MSLCFGAVRFVFYPSNPNSTRFVCVQKFLRTQYSYNHSVSYRIKTCRKLASVKRMANLVALLSKRGLLAVFRRNQRISLLIALSVVVFMQSGQSNASLAKSGIRSQAGTMGALFKSGNTLTHLLKERQTNNNSIESLVWRKWDSVRISTNAKVSNSTTCEAVPPNHSP